MFFERPLSVLCFLPAVCILSLARALSSSSLSVLFPSLFFPSSCNSLLSSIVASTPFVAFFFGSPLGTFFFFLSVPFSPYWKTISKAGVWSSSTKKDFASLGNSLSVALPGTSRFPRLFFHCFCEYFLVF